MFQFAYLMLKCVTSIAHLSCFIFCFLMFLVFIFICFLMFRVSWFHLLFICFYCCMFHVSLCIFNVLAICYVSWLLSPFSFLCFLIFHVRVSCLCSIVSVYLFILSMLLKLAFMFHVSLCIFKCYFPCFIYHF